LLVQQPDREDVQDRPPGEEEAEHRVERAGDAGQLAGTL